MADDDTPKRPMNKRQVWAGGAALLAAGGAVGAILAGSISASAATTPSTTESPTAGPSTAPDGRSHAPGGDSSTPVRGDETEVTGAQAETLRAAALAAVPGGTVIRVETDAGDAAYEVHMTKADGTRVTVKFDENLAVVGVENGMGLGDPQQAGAGQGRGPGHGPAGSSSGSSSTE